MRDNINDIAERQKATENGNSNIDYYTLALLVTLSLAITVQREASQKLFIILVLSGMFSHASCNLLNNELSCSLIYAYAQCKISKNIFKYTVSQKNDTDVTHYRFNPHQPILVIFGRDVAQRVCY